MSRINSRWIPAVLAPVLVLALGVGFSVQANAGTNLPDKSASQILQLINTNPDIAFSGKVVKSAKMGLPPMNIVPDVSASMVESMKKTMPKEMADFIPQESAQGELALALEFLGGTHQARIYVDGKNKARLQVLDMMSERNFVRNGADLWFYDAAKNVAQHSTIDLSKQAQAEADLMKRFGATSPAAAADYLLARAGKDATFTVGSDAQVAGRGVYQLTMKPKSSSSLISSVTFSIDAATGLPLAVVVKASGQSDPAFSVEFQTITFDKPDASLFNFVAPAGAVVKEVAAPKATNPTAAQKAKMEAQAKAIEAEGFDAVVKIASSEIPADIYKAARENRFFTELTKPVAGGRVFTTALLNVLIQDDGDIYAGSVTVAKLLEKAAVK